MPRHLHSQKTGPTQFHDVQKNIRMNIFPGVQNISDEDYALFKAKIDADPKLQVVEDLGDLPIPLDPNVQKVSKSSAGSATKPQASPAPSLETEKKEDTSALSDASDSAPSSPEQSGSSSFSKSSRKNQ